MCVSASQAGSISLCHSKGRQTSLDSHAYLASLPSLCLLPVRLFNTNAQISLPHTHSSAAYNRLLQTNTTLLILRVNSPSYRRTPKPRKSTIHFVSIGDGRLPGLVWVGAKTDLRHRARLEVPVPVSPIDVSVVVRVVVPAQRIEMGRV